MKPSGHRLLIFGRFLITASISVKLLLRFVVVLGQLPSHVQLFVTPWTVACQASLSFTISLSLPTGFPVLHYLPEFAQVHVCCFGDAIQQTDPLLPSFEMKDTSLPFPQWWVRILISQYHTHSFCLFFF